MPNGFITLTQRNFVQPQEGDFRAEQIESYVGNSQDPNGGSFISLLSGATVPVKETVQEIRALIAAEKGTS